MDKNSNEMSIDLEQIDNKLTGLNDKLDQLRGVEKRGHKKNEGTEDNQFRKTVTRYTYHHPEEKSNELATEGEIQKKIKQIKRQLQELESVSKNQLLAADLETKGGSIYNKGRHTYSDKSNRRIFASRCGQVFWQQNTVHVLPVKKVEGSIKNEDIQYNGSVFVDGYVSNGCYIETTGHLWIKKGVGNSTIKAAGDVIIGGGIKGGAACTINTYGNLVASFIENASVEARKSVMTTGQIMHSNVNASDSVVLADEEGKVIGGKVCAAKAVYAAQIGGENEPETVINVGNTPVLQNKKKTLIQKRQKIKSKINEQKKGLSYLEKQKDGNKLKKDQAAKYQKINNQYAQNKNKLRNINRKISAINNKIDDKNSFVSVNNTIYPNVTVNIKNNQKTVCQKKQTITFKNNQSSIEEASLQIPSVDITPTVELDGGHNIVTTNKNGSEPAHSDNKRKIIKYKDDKKLVHPEQILNRLLGNEPDDRLIIIELNKGNNIVEKNNILLAVTTKESDNPEELKRELDPNIKNKVQIRCNKPKAGVKKGADILQTTPDDVAVKILEEPDQSVFNNSNNQYLLHVVRKNAVLSKNTKKESVNDENGEFSLINKKSGLFLTVAPPDGDGMPVQYKDVLDKLRKENYSKKIDKESIEDAIKKQGNQPIKIGPRQPDPDIDGSCEIDINNSNTEANIIIYPAEENGRPITKEEVCSELDERGIQYNENKIDNIFDCEKYKTSVVIAQGTLPEHGRDAEFHFETTPTYRKKSRQDGDHYAGYKYSLVEEGEVIATIRPETIGTDGVDIYGNTIKAQAGEPVKIEAGDNIKKSGSTNQYIATCRGYIVIEGDTVHIRPILVVDGDLDYETGNINFDGTVIIKGRIKDNFTVKASENIEAKSVGAANVKADKNVYIANGVAGKKNGYIKAGERIYTQYAEQAALEGVDVYVEDSVMHSTVKARNNVLVQGAIIGGNTQAKNIIKVRKLGSQAGATTVVKAGIAPDVRTRIKNLEKEIENAKNKFQKAKNIINKINEKNDKNKLDDISKSKQKLYQKMNNIVQSTKNKISALKKQTRQLKNNIEDGGNKGVINTVAGYYESVKITLNNQTVITNNKSIKSTCFQLDEKGKIKKRETLNDIDVTKKKYEPVLNNSDNT